MRIYKQATYYDEQNTVEGTYYDSKYPSAGDTGFSASLELFAIRNAMQVENSVLPELPSTKYPFIARITELADGFGAPGYWPDNCFDWSGVRDSSDKARSLMFEEAAMLLYRHKDLLRAMGLGEKLIAAMTKPPIRTMTMVSTPEQVVAHITEEPLNTYAAQMVRKQREAKEAEGAFLEACGWRFHPFEPGYFVKRDRVMSREAAMAFELRNNGIEDNY